MKKPILLVTALLALGYLAAYLMDRPSRLRSNFAHHLSIGEYEEAGQMLRAPCSLTVIEGGDLVLVDAAGASTTVPAEVLPFRLGGAEGLEPPSDLAMTALGPSEDGVLKLDPVTLHLHVEGGSVSLDAVR